MKIASRCLFALLPALACITLPAQPVLETFDNGFPGTAPDGGWVSPWTFTGNVLTPTVVGDNPLNGGGNYLTYNQTSTLDSALRRAYSGLNNAAAQVIQVTYRVDDFSGAPSTNQYVTITDGDSPTAGGSSADSSFILRAFGDSPGPSLAAMSWGLYNGEKSRLGYNPANWVDSGMALMPGDAYVFTIELHPNTLTYNVTILDTSTTVTTTNTNLGFRDNSLSATNILIFNARTGDASGTETISLDSISVDYPGGIPPVELEYQVVGTNLLLTWSQGLLLEAGNVTGPWTTNAATSPYNAPIDPAVPRKFYQVLVQ